MAEQKTLTFDFCFSMPYTQKQLGTMVIFMAELRRQRAQTTPAA